MARSTEDVKVYINVRIPKSLRKRLRQKALDDDSTLQAVVVAALDAHLGKKS